MDDLDGFITDDGMEIVGTLDEVSLPENQRLSFNPGRNLPYNKNVATKFLELVALGATKREALEKSGIPPLTFLNWCRDNKEFSSSYTESVQLRSNNLVEQSYEQDMVGYYEKDIAEMGEVESKNRTRRVNTLSRWMKAAHPERYMKENMSISHHNVQLNINMPKEMETDLDKYIPTLTLEGDLVVDGGEDDGLGDYI